MSARFWPGIYPEPEMGCFCFGVKTDFKKEGKKMMRFAA